MPVQVAVLDDYQELARHFGPWEELGDDIELTVFHDHISNDGVLRDLLADFEVIVAMRERTPFTGARLASLPNLKLLVTTGMAQRVDRHGRRRATLGHHRVRHRRARRARPSS